jgi:hypothetical protein
MAAEGEPIERGPKGGKKHKPGRGHDRKSSRAKKRRFARKAARKQQEDEDARRAWEEWDKLPDDVKRLLGPAGEPKMPRPRDEY